MATKVTYKDILDYFDEATPDMAELVLNLIEDKVNEKNDRRAKQSAKMKKAWAARNKEADGQKGIDAGLSSVTADPNVQAEVAAQIPVRRPGRPRHVDPNEGLTREQSA